MSGPDRIWAYEINYPISKVHGEKRWVPWEPKPITLQMREGFFGRKTRQIPQVFHEYIRRDAAVLAALPEVQALIAGAYEAAARLCWAQVKRRAEQATNAEDGSVQQARWIAGRIQAEELAKAMEALIPADAIAARDAMIAEAVKAARGDLDHPITAYTFAVQHNPNCPSPWLVRMPGKSCMIDMKPYRGFHLTKEDMTGDLLAFGKTFKDAADAAIRKRGEG